MPTETTRTFKKDLLVRGLPIFAHLERSQVLLIAEKSRLLEFKKDELIYSEGDAPNAFYCLITGRVVVYTKPQEGRLEILEYLHRGGYFGIISLLTGEPHSVSAKAVNDSLILKIRKEDFDILLKKVPHLAIHLSQTLSRRLKKKDLHHKTIFESTIISVYSTAKGMGRSLYAINLAVSLHQETCKKVILLDMSPQGDELSGLLGITEKVEAITLKSDVFNEANVKSKIAPHEAGIHLLNIAHDPEFAYDVTQITPLLSYLTNDFHYVVADLPHVMDKTVFKALTQSDLIHLLSDGEGEHISATAHLADELKKDIEGHERKVKIILNKLKESAIEIEKLYADLPAIPEGTIEREGAALVKKQPELTYSKAIRRIAREIGGVTVGLALGSGAAMALSQIGVMKVLEREKIPIDVVAGSSMGALIAAFWASGLSAEELEKVTLKYRTRFRTLRLLDISVPWSGLIPGKRVVKFLRAYLGKKTFRDVKLPLKIVASNLENRQQVVISEGPLVDAVRASISIPGVFKPLVRQNEVLVDGGIVEPVPVDTLILMGVKKIIAVNTILSPHEVLKEYTDDLEKRKKEAEEVKRKRFVATALFLVKKRFSRAFSPNIADIIMRSIQSMEHILAESSCEQADVVLRPAIPRVQWFEFYNGATLIKHGETEAERFLPQIKKLIFGET